MIDDLDSKQDDTLGKFIKKARENKQISLEEVAEKLLLSKHIIVAIEDDDYSKIPAKVYAKGYIKAYAQLLQIPAEKLLEKFRSLNAYSSDNVVESNTNTNIKTETKKCLNVNESLKKRHNQLILTGVFVALVLLLVFGFKFKWFTKKNDDLVNGSGFLSSVVEESKENTLEAEEEGIPVFTVNVADDVTEFRAGNND